MTPTLARSAQRSATRKARPVERPPVQDRLRQAIATEELDLTTLADLIDEALALAPRRLATTERRVGALDLRHEALLEVIRVRASDPSIARFPGGSTGLLDSVGRFDAPLLAELRRIELQAAVEMGQWGHGLAVDLEGWCNDESVGQHDGAVRRRESLLLSLDPAGWPGPDGVPGDGAAGVAPEPAARGGAGQGPGRAAG